MSWDQTGGEVDFEAGWLAGYYNWFVSGFTELTSSVKLDRVAPDLAHLMEQTQAMFNHVHTTRGLKGSLWGTPGPYP